MALGANGSTRAVDALAGEGVPMVALGAVSAILLLAGLGLVFWRRS